MDRSRCIVWMAVCAVAATAFTLNGCATTDEAATVSGTKAGTGAADVSPGAMTLCPDCGHYKGSEQCCGKDMERCEGCGMALGSPGCCMTK